MPKKPSKKNDELSQQIAELTEDVKRIQADFTNYKRRAEEDQLRAVSIGREGVIAILLPTIDNIERSLNHVPKDIKDHEYVKALQSVAKKMMDDLAKLGLKKMDVLDKEFDPETMEAVSMEDGEGDTEVVCEELQPGYMYGETVLRHAMVKVMKK